jgi:two-component system CheB/CheR fusion protein
MNQDEEPGADRASQTADALDRTPVVGIGASAGGIKALQKFFELLPPKIGVAFVVIVHLDPEHRSELPEILASRSRIPVKQVTSTSALTPGCVYVIPPDRQLRISDNEISAVPFEEPRGQRAPIDHFFRSLADQHGDGFGIILSGAGSDGALGVKAVKAAGGIILVQDPDEAEYPSMPRSAIATEVADFVLPISDMVSRIVELVRAKRHLVLVKAVDEEEQLRRVLTHLRVRTGHDFSHYKRSTVMRRVLRRMQVARKETIEDYFTFLRENADEAQELLADLLISVTTFFRDSKAFDALAKHAIAPLFNARQPDAVIRVWVAGCATGEEAYSVAILLLEEASRHELRPEIQIFASDLDAKALAIAREGCYPATIEADLNEDRLRRFFFRDGDQYRIKRDVRDIILFANHSLLKDPPFSRLDIISCRNVLIYLDRDLQAQVLATLHYGLNQNGYLLLGTSESAEYPEGLFRTIDRDYRLYQSTGRSAHHLLALPRTAGLPSNVEPAYQPAIFAKTRGALEAHRTALESTAPPSILVDERGRALHLSESAGRYLLPSVGPLTADVIDLVRPELRFELRNALHLALERHESTFSEPILVGFNGNARRVHLQVKPVVSREPNQAAQMLILFIEGEAKSAVSAVSHASEGTVERLEQQLELARGQLRTTREEFEAANEELRAANEELQSINEEYRSTAEELETSKEELQSINEELQTVNAELKLKLETVSRANSDLQNLMAATDFATLFLDPGLRIKRFTPRLAELFSITLSDIGRPITDFAHQLDYEGLSADARLVLTNLTPIAREVRSRQGGWFQVRYRPYRTVDDKIDGVVVTFLDVTERHQMEDALRHSEHLLRQETRLVELSRAPIFVWDFDGGIVQWNRGSEELYGYTKSEAMGKAPDDLLKTHVPNGTFAAVKKAILEDGTWCGELDQIAKNGHNLTVETQIEMATSGDRRFVLESTRDITHSRVWESRQRLLLRELTHRVKNTLAVIQSMVHQTWRNSPSVEDFIERLDGRVAALAGSHTLLVETDWQGTDLRSQVDSQLAAYISDQPGRVRIEGGLVKLAPDLAMPFGMVLHELATNAAKYGALSKEKGQIDLSWELTGRNQSKVLNVIWQERNGPTPKQPTREGFGSKLIKTGIPGSTVQQEFLPEGFRCTIQVPISGDDHGVDS